jgi:copper chaperone
MEKSVLRVNGMSCQHCVKAVETAVGALPGVSGVSVDLAAKTATVEYDPGKCTLTKSGWRSRIKVTKSRIDAKREPPIQKGNRKTAVSFLGIGRNAAAGKEGERI